MLICARDGDSGEKAKKMKERMDGLKRWWFQVGVGGLVGLVSCLSDSQTALLANMSTFIHKYACAVVNINTWMS